MKLQQTRIADVVIIEPSLYEDERGWFMESFNEQAFHRVLKAQGLAIPKPLVQDNHSMSNRGVVRGLHYQLAPYAQGKLVRVTRGRVYDVAVDLRRNSKTFGQWVGVELSAENNKMLWIPEGFAHGFMALEENTHFLYKTTAYYNKSMERSIKWNDPELGIDWPELSAPFLNEKDDKAVSFSKAEFDQVKTACLQPQVIDLPVIGDERGSLTAIEQFSTVPFNIKRVYYIYATQENIVRGLHAHKHLTQLAVCVSGSCRMLLDDGSEKVEVLLDSPHKGLLINNRIWREMREFSSDCVLMVLADDYYDEADYIRNYSTFLQVVNDGKE